MAIDEAIMLAMQRGEVPPTLRLYRWRPSAVSIGTFQGLSEEVDHEYCRRNNIDYVRRLTGGGAVYHDFNGEITYSIIVPRGHRLAPDNILRSYELVCSGIVEGLALLGLRAEFRPINDIVINGRKVSGNAQTRRYSCLLQHGTVLLDLDIETMFSVLKVPAEKVSDKMVSEVRQRVTSVRDALGREVSMTELRDALAEGFSSALSIELGPGALTAEERESMQQLVREKYSTDEWNARR